MMPSRRRLLTAAAAGVGAVGGLWFALRGERPTLPDAADGLDIWSLRFEQPQGGELLMASLRDKPLVLNFWATWCPPCIQEMPELDRFQREFAGQGWAVLGLAIDAAAPVREFLVRAPVSYAIGLAGAPGIDLSRRLGNATGALPYTVVLDKRGQILHHKLGQTSFDELAGWARAR